MAGFSMVVPGMTPAMFGSGAATGFGGFLGRWDDAYRSGMKIGQDQGTANSKYSLAQTKANTDINKARREDRMNGLSIACEMNVPGACDQLNAYKRAAGNNPAAAVGVVDQDEETRKLFGFSGADPSKVGVNPATGRTSAMSYMTTDEDRAEKAYRDSISGLDESFGPYQRNAAQGG